MVSEPTHIGGGVLDLVLTDVSEFIGVRVGSPIEAADHSEQYITITLGNGILTVTVIIL